MQQSAFAYAQPYDANKAPYWNGSMFLNADTVGGPAAATGMAAQQPLLPPPHLQPSANGMVHPDTPPAVNNNNAEAFNQTWQVGVFWWHAAHGRTTAAGQQPQNNSCKTKTRPHTPTANAALCVQMGGVPCSPKQLTVCTQSTALQAAAVGAGAGTSEGTDNYAVKAEQQDEETSYTPKGKKVCQSQHE